MSGNTRLTQPGLVGYPGFGPGDSARQSYERSTGVELSYFWGGDSLTCKVSGVTLVATGPSPSYDTTVANTLYPGSNAFAATQLWSHAFQFAADADAYEAPSVGAVDLGGATDSVLMHVCWYGAIPSDLRCLCGNYVAAGDGIELRVNQLGDVRANGILSGVEQPGSLISSAMQANKWHHAVMIVDRTNNEMRHGTDLKYDTTPSTWATGSLNSTRPFAIGHAGTSFLGQIMFVALAVDPGGSMLADQNPYTIAQACQVQVAGELLYENPITSAR